MEVVLAAVTGAPPAHQLASRVFNMVGALVALTMAGALVVARQHLHVRKIWIS